MYNVLCSKKLADKIDEIPDMLPFDDMMSESEWRDIERVKKCTGLGLVLSKRLYHKTGDVDKAIDLFQSIMEDLNETD